MADICLITVDKMSTQCGFASHVQNVQVRPETINSAPYTVKDFDLFIYFIYNSLNHYSYRFWHFHVNVLNFYATLAYAFRLNVCFI